MTLFYLLHREKSLPSLSNLRIKVVNSKHLIAKGKLLEVLTSSEDKLLNSTIVRAVVGYYSMKCRRCKTPKIPAPLTSVRGSLP